MSSRPSFCGCSTRLRFECYCDVPDDCQCEGIPMTEGREELRKELIGDGRVVATGGISEVEEDADNE